jgi:hypothetical protein
MVMVDHEWIWRGMIGDWQNEWDLKRRGSDRSVNRHDTLPRSGLLEPPLGAGKPLKLAFAEQIDLTWSTMLTNIAIKSHIVEV